MKLDLSRENTTTVVSLPVTSLDADNSKAFRQAMGRVLGDARQVVIDMETLEFIDSSGLGALLSCLREITEDGGDMKLCGLSEPVRAVFDLVRLHRILEIHPDLGEAIASFERRAA